MKTFQEWLESKKINEGIFDSKGAKAWAGSILGGSLGVGPIVGAQIGYGMGDTKKQPSSSAGPGMIEKFISWWADASDKSKIKKLIDAGWSEEDAEHYVTAPRGQTNFHTAPIGKVDVLGRPLAWHYKQKYPNSFK